MKIRNGFVSNSSSSSFVVAFPHMPMSVEDLRQMLFGKETQYYSPYSEDTYKTGYRVTITPTWPTRQVAESVWEQISNQTVNNKEAIADAARGGDFEGTPEYDYHRDSCDKAYWDDFYHQEDEAAEKWVDTFIKEHADSAIYTFEFSDNEGSYGCALEHGNLFENLPHIQVSRH